MTLNVKLFSLTFRSTFPLFLISSANVNVVIPLTQLPMFLSLVLGFGLGIVRTALIGTAKSSICLPERGAVQPYKCTQTYTCRQSEEMALPKHKLHSMLARICIHANGTSSSELHGLVEVV